MNTKRTWMIAGVAIVLGSFTILAAYLIIKESRFTKSTEQPTGSSPQRQHVPQSAVTSWFHQTFGKMKNTFSRSKTSERAPVNMVVPVNTVVPVDMVAPALSSAPDMSDGPKVPDVPSSHIAVGGTGGNQVLDVPDHVYRLNLHQMELNGRKNRPVQPLDAPTFLGHKNSVHSDILRRMGKDNVSDRRLASLINLDLSSIKKGDMAFFAGGIPRHENLTRLGDATSDYSYFTSGMAPTL